MSEICTQTTAFEAGLQSCLSQDFDRQPCASAAAANTLQDASPYPTLLDPPHELKYSIFRLKLVQILISQSTGSVNACDLPHLQLQSKLTTPIKRRKACSCESENI